MTRRNDKVEKLEAQTGGPELFLHVFPDTTQEQAIADYEREHGPIPEDAHVIIFHHNFRSRI